MQWRFAILMHISITFALVNEMSTAVQNRDNNKRRTEKSGGFLKNICDITDRNSKVHCYCENTREPKNATKAECWVFNGGIPSDDPIWQSFASQPSLHTLSFNVRVDGALNYIPTKSLQYLQRLRSLNIKYGNIGDIHSFAFANLTNLNEAILSSNQIGVIESYAFAHLINITFINLEDNAITDIDKVAFFDLPKLQKLIFTKNNISSIYEGTFQHTFNLLELDLNKNTIYHLSRHTFDGLANLRKLDLRRNCVTNLTEFTFAELWNLQELLLGKNDIKYISERAFDGLSQLWKLSLDDNKLTSLPAGLFEGIRGLSSLDLRINELHVLTFDNINPIFENLKTTNSNLLIEDNSLLCDCRLKWIYLLRNETKSEHTKNSLERVTCKADETITVSSAYNRMEDERNANNKKGFSIDNTVYINSDTVSMDVNEDKLEVNEIKASASKNIKRSVLKIPPERLPCPPERKGTEVPPQDSFIPIRNEMITLIFQGQNKASYTPLNLRLCFSLSFLFFFT